VSKLKRIRIDQAYIGSCAGGRLDELRMVGKILRNRKVHPHVKLIIVPSSLEILAGLAEENLLQIFIAAGALIGAPGCGACFGSHDCLLAGKEVCISTITSNLPGRMGSPEAQIYLGSSATVAASSIEGKLADPRDYF